MEKNNSGSSPRRKFLGTIATGAAALGLAAFSSPALAKAGTLSAPENNNTDLNDADDWFNKINGKHRVVYDVSQPHHGQELLMPFAWVKVFLLTNAATGTPEKESSVVTVWRHSGIAFAMEDRIWAKYKLGEMFKIDDDTTKAPAIRNRFWKPNPGYSIPGAGPVPIGIDELQASGAMFCVCNMAITVYSAIAAQQMGLKHEDVMKDWLSGVLPGVQVVPSGVWALGRAQEHKCAYIFAG
ncbi:MAG: twin-arginine translocation signal domain-containing protein [Ferruginibacter sp.]